jgi:phosphoribosylaminoimidazole (AIR) synthetase
MVIVADAQSADAVAEALAALGETVIRLGQVTDAPDVVYSGALL